MDDAVRPALEVGDCTLAHLARVSDVLPDRQLSAEAGDDAVLGVKEGHVVAEGGERVHLRPQAALLAAHLLVPLVEDEGVRAVGSLGVLAHHITSV